MDYPKFLYHYTNLESLILILKNKTIRLKPLDQLDDMDEGDFENFSAMSKYIFISSWTQEEKESIPFWNMYTRDMHGVRIKLPLNPFKRYRYNSPHPYLNVDSDFEFYLPYEKINNVDYCILPIKGEEYFYPVKYTEDEQKLYSKLIDVKDGQIAFYLGNAGLYKRTAWDFQKEWRYRLVALPGPLNIINQSGIDVLLGRMKSGYEIPLSYIDLELKEDSLKNMEILAGPKMTGGEYEILKMIVNMYLPTANIIKSELRIR